MRWISICVCMCFWNSDRYIGRVVRWGRLRLKVMSKTYLWIFLRGFTGLSSYFGFGFEGYHFLFFAIFFCLDPEVASLFDFEGCPSKTGVRFMRWIRRNNNKHMLRKTLNRFKRWLIWQPISFNIFEWAIYLKDVRGERNGFMLFRIQLLWSQSPES